MGGAYSAGGVFVIKEKEKGSSKRYYVGGKDTKKRDHARFERIPSDPGGLAIKTDDEDDQFFHRFCWDQLRKHDQELIPRVRLKTPYRTPPLLTISRMLKELENESKKKKMDSPSRNRARSTSDLKSRQYIPNENAPTVKRYNRVSQGNRSRSRYEIYNSTTMPFGKRYREMVSSNIHDIEDNNESSTDSSQSTYATCCSEVETLKMSGFHCIDENTKKHEVTLQASTDETVTEARNYDVSTEEKNKLIENDELKSTAMVKSINERRLMYNMPKSSNWNTYQEEQLTYEPEDQQVHKEVVVRSRSLFSLLEDQPVENLNQNNTQKLVKAISENYLYKEDNQKPRVVDTTPSKRYNSTINLKISNIKSKSQGIKYKSQSDLCRSVEESKRLNRPKSMDYLTHKENKSHTETLKKHFYYHPLKPIKKLNDNELPDPDKVQSTRQLFQKVLKIPLPPSLNNQNPKIGPRPTQEVRVVPDSHKPSIQKCVSVDMGTNIHNKWTDSGSVSSGVGSEASFETESSENNARGGKYSSDDEEYLADKTTIELVGRPVSAEILNKIRKFGTSVTYYGGKVISSSRGEVCSPMTMTIMDEIRHQKEENIKLRLVKSNSCGSRIELMEEIKHGEKQVEAIREEEEDENLRREKSNQDILDNSSSKSVSSDELSWKALIVIRKKMNNVPVFDMEFEEFEVLDDNNKNRD